MRDTCGIHESQMHPERDVSDMKATCGIHEGFIRDTCEIHVSSVAIKIQSRYIQDPCKIHDKTCGIHAGYMRETCLGGLGECMDAIMESSAPIRPPMSALCRSGSAPAPSSSSIFCFVMATLIPAGLPPWSSAKRTNFSCCTVRVELALFLSFGITSWDPLPWIM